MLVALELTTSARDGEGRNGTMGESRLLRKLMTVLHRAVWKGGKIYVATSCIGFFECFSFESETFFVFIYSPTPLKYILNPITAIVLINHTVFVS